MPVGGWFQHLWDRAPSRQIGAGRQAQGSQHRLGYIQLVHPPATFSDVCANGQTRSPPLVSNVFGRYVLQIPQHVPDHRGQLLDRRKTRSPGLSPRLAFRAAWARQFHDSWVLRTSSAPPAEGRWKVLRPFPAGEFDRWLLRGEDRSLAGLLARRRPEADGNSLARPSVLDVEPPVRDDAQLIESTLAGETSAFGHLVCKYQDRLYNTVLHVVGSAEDGRDVVQEAFVQAFLKLESFQRSSAFYTWLYRIAFNVATSYCRRRRPVVSVEYTRETTGQEPIDCQPGPHYSLELAERRRQVQDAIASLPEEYRAVVVLREIDGCCYETIAEILELPIGTVRSRLHRARLQLREQLRPVFIDEPRCRK